MGHQRVLTAGAAAAIWSPKVCAAFGQDSSSGDGRAPFVSKVKPRCLRRPNLSKRFDMLGISLKSGACVCGGSRRFAFRRLPPPPPPFLRFGSGSMSIGNWNGRLRLSSIPSSADTPPLSQHLDISLSAKMFNNFLIQCVCGRTA